MKIRAHVDESCPGHMGSAICVSFKWNRTSVDRIKTIPGARWSKRARHWHLPLETLNCHLLRKEFGTALVVTKGLSRWYREREKQEEKMHNLAQSEEGLITRLWEEMPALARAIHLGPRGKFMTSEERAEALKGPGSYQAADVRYLVESPGPINGNEQGLGKTLEHIAMVWEEGIEEGDHLVLCPRSAVEGTWGKELRNWHLDRDDVEVFMMSDTGKKEDKEFDRWQASKARVRWVVMNPGKLRAQQDPFRNSKIIAKAKGKKKEAACYCKRAKYAHEHYELRLPGVMSTHWSTICIDEAHREGVKNPESITARTISAMSAGKKVLMTGTPMAKLGGWDLWGLLHFQNPKRFGSKWSFVDGYYEVIDGHFGKKIGPLREDREEALFKALSTFILRRTKKEVFSELPDKIYNEILVEMTPRQRTQYKMMSDESWAPAGPDEMEGVGTLPRRTRLKQLANGHCKIDAGGIAPIRSPKVERMIENVKDLGGKHLVFTRSRRMAEFALADLQQAGLYSMALTGKTKREGRAELIEGMQEGDLEVAVIVTTAGGTSLTLDMADHVHFLDESDNPGNDEQAEDRAHRVSRIHQVTVWIYRTIGTIDVDIAQQKEGKSATHRRLLDDRRRITSSYYQAST